VHCPLHAAKATKTVKSLKGSIAGSAGHFNASKSTVNRELPNQIGAKAGNRDIADLNQHQAHLSLACSLSCRGIWKVFNRYE
jgi:hypothetical protein